MDLYLPASCGYTAPCPACGRDAAWTSRRDGARALVDVACSWCALAVTEAIGEPHVEPGPILRAAGGA